jgi:hypothetical protein
LLLFSDKSNVKTFFSKILKLWSIILSIIS